MNTSNQIKRFLILALLLMPVSLCAQFIRTSYFMENAPHRQQLNPALAPGRGFINIPVLGAFNASINSSSIGYQDVLDIIKNSEGEDYFMSENFLNRLDARNNVNVDLNTDILSAGWWKNKNFWSFNVGLRNQIGISIPRNMFEFLRNMNDLQSDDWDRLAHIDEFVDQQSMQINSHTEIGVGFARAINSRLSVGVRVKALLGLGNLNLHINDIHVKSNVSGYNGIDWNNPTPEQIQNLQGSASIKVGAKLECSSKMLELSETDNYLDDIEMGTFGIAGYGAAIDLGVSYRLLDKLTLSASVLDLGFISWSKKSNNVAKANANMSYSLQDENDRAEFTEMVSSGEILNFDLLKMDLNYDLKNSRTSSTTSTVVLGAEYEVFEKWLTVGALYSARFVEPKTINELSFSATCRPAKFFNASISYSILQGAGKTFGMAFKIGPLFMGTDYMLLGKSSKNINAYLGLSIPLGKAKIKS